MHNLYNLHIYLYKCKMHQLKHILDFYFIFLTDLPHNTNKVNYLSFFKELILFINKNPIQHNYNLNFRTLSNSYFYHKCKYHLIQQKADYLNINHHPIDNHLQLMHKLLNLKLKSNQNNLNTIMYHHYSYILLLIFKPTYTYFLVILHHFQLMFNTLFKELN